MNNGKKRNGKELEPATKEGECTCGLCHKYKTYGSLVLGHEFDKELAVCGKWGVAAPAWTCHDSCMVALLSGCGGYGVG